MAILITALFVMGIEPGPRLMLQRMDLVFLMIWTVILGNFIGTIMGMGLTNLLARATFLRAAVLVPVLLTIILNGSFVVRGTWFDMIVAIIFGLLGYAMKKLDYSRPAFIIGFVLGLMVEKNLYLSIRISGNAFFLKPLALGLLLLTIFVLLYNVRKMFKSRKEGYFEAVDGKEKADVQVDLLFCLLLMVMLGVFFVAILGYKPVSRRAPLIVMIPLAVMLGGQLTALVKRLKQSRAKIIESSFLLIIKGEKIKKGVLLLLWMIILMFLMYFAGHVGGIALFLILFLRLASNERWLLSISLSLGVTVSLYVLFELLLGIPFNPGVILKYVGTFIYS